MHRRLPAESNSQREVGWRDPLARYEARGPLAIRALYSSSEAVKGACDNARANRSARRIVQMKLALGLSFTTPRQPLESSKSISERLLVVFAVDVLSCPLCSGRVKLIAYIASASVARRILEHLGLPTTGPTARLLETEG